MRNTCSKLSLITKAFILPKCDKTENDQSLMCFTDFYSFCDKYMIVSSSEQCLRFGFDGNSLVIFGMSQ